MDMISKKISTFEQEMQFKTYNIFRKLIFGKSKSLIVKEISRFMEYLKKQHGLNYEDVFIQMFVRYQENRYYRQFKEYSGGLEKFIAEYLCKELDELKKQLNQNRIKESAERIHQAWIEKNKEQELLSLAYGCFQWIIGGLGNYAINNSIRNKIKALMEQFGMMRQEILVELFEDFLEKNILQRYDSQRASLYTFLLYYINNRLTDKIRSKKRFNREIKVGGFDEEELYRAEGISPNDHLSISGMHKSMNPEQLLIKKQLIQHIVKFLGEDDAKVFLGLESRKSESERLGVHYDAYCKRLHRKIMENLSEFKKAGYC